eukprot:11989878-Alexandrium_andersonii.AAC.1
MWSDNAYSLADSVDALSAMAHKLILASALWKLRLKPAELSCVASPVVAAPPSALEVPSPLRGVAL